MGLASYKRRFIKGYGILSKPLTELLKKNCFNWSDASTEAFYKLKQIMCSGHVLALSDFSTEFVVETYVSDEGLGAVLMQKGKHVAFLSIALSDKHKAFSVYEKEMLAMVLDVEKWRPYLLGGHFKVKTDHQSLKFLLQ